MIEWTYVTDFPVDAVSLSGFDNLMPHAEKSARRMAAFYNMRIVRRKSWSWASCRLVLHEEDEIATYEDTPADKATIFVLRIVYFAEPMVDVVPDL